MKPLPLRTRLTLWSALVTGVALLTFSAGAALSFYFAQIKVIDRRLAADAKQFLAESPANLQAELAELVRDRPRFLVGAAYRQGETLSLAADLKPVAQLLSAPPPGEKFSNVEAGGKHLRLGSFNDSGRQIVLAADLWPALDPVFDLLGAYLLALPVVLVVVAGGSWWMARRALLPVTQITNAAAQITAERLDARLTAPLVDDEIGRHTRVLNEMLDRLQRSFEQASRFTADAAHELRTPLTIMRGQIEEALRSGNFSPPQERLLVGLLEENTGLQKISENLLLLARFDAGKNPLERSPVDFTALVDELREDADLLAAPRQIKIFSEITPGVQISGDAIMLRRLALNLVDNAVKFNREGGELRLGLSVAEDVAIFVVANTGPGFPPDRQAVLFQRFFRPDSARSRAAGGSGLGLSLCREIVLAHGGEITLSRADESWTEFSVRLPRLQD